MRNMRNYVGLVLGLLLAASGPSYADVVANEFYDLNDTAAPIEPPPGWTHEFADGLRDGIEIRTVVGGLQVYTRNDIAIDAGQNWSFEAVLSAFQIGGTGEHGARMTIRFTDPSALLLPPAPVPKFRSVMLRLLEDAAGNRQFVLADELSGVTMALLALDWDASVPPRWRIRIRRDRSDIIMEAEPSHTGPLMSDPPSFPEPPPYSVSVPIASFSPTLGMKSQFGFGHYLGGGGTSFWEDIHVTAADDATTQLPYWPTPPPAPTLAIDGSSAPETVDLDFDIDLGPPGAYMSNDVALLSLDESGGPDTRIVPDPSNTNSGLLHEDFNGLDAGQTVTGTVTVEDASGRSRAGPPTLLQLPVAVPALGPLASFAALGILATGLMLLRRRRLTSSLHRNTD